MDMKFYFCAHCGTHLFTRDRRYLRFVVQVVKLLVAALAGVLIFFVVERVLVML